eukprot:523007_1
MSHWLILIHILCIYVSKSSWHINSMFSLPQPMGEMIYAKHNGSLFIFGGEIGTSTEWGDHILIYNPNVSPVSFTRINESQPDSTMHSCGAKCTASFNDIIYIIPNMLNQDTRVATGTIWTFNVLTKTYITHSIPTMPHPVYAACITEDYIHNILYLIGGTEGKGGQAQGSWDRTLLSTQIQALMIDTNQWLALNNFEQSPIAFQETSCEYFNDKIFVFGGDTSVGAMTNHFQYYDIPPPTPYPTNEPSENPTITTINPTHSPSDVTINPTKFPTITPTTSYPTTSEPTKHPTLKPTTNPTVRPSTSPTLKPTVFGECGFAQISGFKYPLDHCFATKYSSTSMSYKYSCTSGILYYNIYQSNLDCSAPATSIIDYSSSVDEFSCSPYKCRNYVEYTYWYNDKCTHDSDFILSGYVIDQCLYNSYSNKYQKVTCSQDSLAVTTYIDTQCIQEYHYTPSPNIVPTPPPISVCLEI